MNYIKLIRNSPVFAGVDEKYLEFLLSREKSITKLKPGEYIFRQGDTGDALYVVLEGSLEVEVEQGGKKITVDTISDQLSLGELSLLISEPRTASVKAKGDAHLFCLDSDTYNKEIEKNEVNALRISFNISKIIANRLAKTNKTIFTLINKPVEKELAVFRSHLAKELLL